MAHRITVSKAELQARELLDRLKLPWTAQVPIDRWVIDLMLPGKVAIEVHGTYWHDRPSNRARDLRKRATLEAMGYRLIELRTDQMHLWWEALLPFTSYRKRSR